MNGGTLSYTIADNATWFSVSPPNGSSTGGHNRHTVIFDTWQLLAGSYSAAITISAPGATNTPQTIAVTLKVLASDPGWRYDRCDEAGSAYNPYGSKLRSTGGFAEKWSAASDGEWTGLKCGDVDGDGRLEIVIALGGHIRVYQDNGAPGTDLDLTGLWQWTYVDMLADVNEDGIDDIAVGGRPSRDAAQIRFYSGTGTLLKTLSRASTFSTFDSYLAAKDILPNGDVIVMYDAIHNKEPRGVGRWSYAAGIELWNYNVGPQTGRLSHRDIDGDGKMEITMFSVFGPNGGEGDGYNHNGTRTTDDQFWTIVVDEDGNEHFTVGYGADGQSSGYLLNFFTDLDRNGTGEVLAVESHEASCPGTSQIHLLNSSNGSIIRTFNGAVNGIWEGIAFADLNNDGRDEVVAGSNSGTIYVLDSILNVITSEPMSGSVCAINDLDGDGLNEIVIADGATVRVVNRNLAELWSHTVGTNIGSVAVSDLDRNGRNEIILGADRLYVFEAQPPTAVRRSWLLYE